MTEHSRQLQTGDPAILKALAHPLRIEIMAILDREGEQTASQLAERLGQNVANCSFHLRLLEKHGYVERAQQRGREKPWRAAHDSRNLTPDPEDPQSVAGATQVASLFVQREAQRITQALQQGGPGHETPEWVLAWTVNTSEFWATAEEMADLVQRIMALTQPFEGRSADPSLRPAGARRGHLFATVNPDPSSEPHVPGQSDAHPTDKDAS